MNCDCKEWKKGMAELNDIILIAHLHGIELSGKYTFKFCPYCSKKLEKELGK